MCSLGLTWLWFPSLIIPTPQLLLACWFQSCWVSNWWLVVVLEWTVWCLRTVQFFVKFDMFKVRFWAKMWCSESSMFRHSMFGVFEVWYFGVHSKTTPYDMSYCNLRIYYQFMAKLTQVISPSKWMDISFLCILFYKPF